MHKTPRSPWGFFRLSQEENIFIVWAVTGSTGPAAPHSGTNYRGAEPSAEVSLIPGVRSLSNAITWGGWQVSGVPSVMHFGLGQVGDVYSWQHCAATQLGKEEFLLINAMMYDMLAAQTL